MLPVSAMLDHFAVGAEHMPPDNFEPRTILMFQPRKGYRTTAILLLLASITFGIASAGVAWGEALNDRHITAVARLSAFACAMTASVAAWMLMVSFRVRLLINGDNLIWHGVLSRKEIAVSGATAACWISMNRGSLRLFSPTASLTVDFDLFEPEERLWLIDFLRNRLPACIQHEWGRFCYAVALPLRDSEPPVPRTIPPDRIAITRRRWDWYFVPAIFLCAVIEGMVSRKLFGAVSMNSPVGLTVIWLLLRFTTPKQGLAGTRINADPWTKRLLIVVLVLPILWGVRLFLLDLPNLPKPHVYVVGAIAILLIVGEVVRQARMADREHREQELPKIQKAIRSWDEMGVRGGETAACGTGENES